MSEPGSLSIVLQFSCVTAWIQNRENSGSLVTLLQLTTTAGGSVQLAMDNGRAYVSGTGMADSSELSLPRDAWVYVGLSWRRSDGRVQLRVRYDANDVESTSTAGFSSGVDITVCCMYRHNFLPCYVVDFFDQNTA